MSFKNSIYYFSTLLFLNSCIGLEKKYEDSYFLPLSLALIFFIYLYNLMIKFEEIDYSNILFKSLIVRTRDKVIYILKNRFRLGDAEIKDFREKIFIFFLLIPGFFGGSFFLSIIIGGINAVYERFGNSIYFFDVIYFLFGWASIVLFLIAYVYESEKAKNQKWYKDFVKSSQIEKLKSEVDALKNTLEELKKSQSNSSEID